MDPLSITAGAIALLGACTQASGTFMKIRRLKEAPAIIQSLNNEISDLHLIILDINDMIEKAKIKRLTFSHVDKRIFELCSSTLNQAREKVQEVEGLVHYSLLKAGREEYLKINKVIFLQEYKNLSLLQADLRDIRQKITALFIRLGMKEVSRIEVLLESMSNELPVLMQSQARIEGTLLHMQSPPPTPASTTQRRPQNEAIHVLEKLEHLGSSMQSSIQVLVSRQTPRAFEVCCDCSRQTKLVEMHTLFGSLFLGYAANPVVSSCNRQHCLDRKRTVIQLSYFFPLWCLRLVLLFRAQFISSSNITFSFSIRPIVPTHHIVYDMMEVGNLRGVKNLLVNGQISLDGQNSNLGTLLHVSILYAKPAITKALIDMGANIHSEHHVRFSPQKLAWSYILEKSRAAEWTQTMESLFPNPDLEELYEFPQLHKAVLGLIDKSAKDVIQADASEINKTDRDGRTALSWAAARGDSQTVQLLLAHAADCNKTDALNKAPAFFAVRQSRQCTEILLKAGANIHNSDSLRNNLLTQVICYLNPESEALELVKSLVQANIDVNARNTSGVTPIMFTQRQNYIQIARYLIQQGADLLIYDDLGQNLFTDAIVLNLHAMISMLLEHHADHTGNMEQYGTLVHLSATYGDVQTLQLLAQGGLRRRNINAKNKAGLTPVQIAIQRENVDAEWRHAFFDFLRSIDEDLAQPEESIEEAPGEGLAMPGSYW